MYRRPESVLVVVYTKDLKILVIKRTDPFPCWQSITGSLNNDEKKYDAALRELQEETGLTNEGTMISTGVYRTFTIDQRWKHKYDNNTKENIEYEFYYELKRPHKIKLNSKEHSNFEWVDIEDAIKMVWSWTNKESLNKLAMNS